MAATEFELCEATNTAINISMLDNVASFEKTARIPQTQREVPASVPNVTGTVSGQPTTTQLTGAALPELEPEVPGISLAPVQSSGTLPKNRQPIDQSRRRSVDNATNPHIMRTRSVTDRENRAAENARLIMADPSRSEGLRRAMAAAGIAEATQASATVGVLPPVSDQTIPRQTSGRVTRSSAALDKRPMLLSAISEGGAERLSARQVLHPDQTQPARRTEITQVAASTAQNNVLRTQVPANQEEVVRGTQTAQVAETTPRPSQQSAAVRSLPPTSQSGRRVECRNIGSDRGAEGSGQQLITYMNRCVSFDTATMLTRFRAPTSFTNEELSDFQEDRSTMQLSEREERLLERRANRALKEVDTRMRPGIERQFSSTLVDVNERQLASQVDATRDPEMVTTEGREICQAVNELMRGNILQTGHHQ